VFDWKNTARAKIQELTDAKAHAIGGETFVNDWRGEMFQKKTTSLKALGNPARPTSMLRPRILKTCARN